LFCLIRRYKVREGCHFKSTGNLSQFLSVSLSVYLYLSLSLSASHFPSLFNSFSPRLSLSLFVCLCLFLYLSVSLSDSLLLSCLILHFRSMYFLLSDPNECFTLNKTTNKTVIHRKNEFFSSRCFTNEIKSKKERLREMKNYHLKPIFNQKFWNKIYYWNSIELLDSLSLPHKNCPRCSVENNQSSETYIFTEST
jgi:hypothetical protein